MKPYSLNRKAEAVIMTYDLENGRTDKKVRRHQKKAFRGFVKRQLRKFEDK